MLSDSTATFGRNSETDSSLSDPAGAMATAIAAPAAAEGAASPQSAALPRSASAASGSGVVTETVVKKTGRHGGSRSSRSPRRSRSSRASPASSPTSSAPTSRSPRGRSTGEAKTGKERGRQSTPAPTQAARGLVVSPRPRAGKPEPDPASPGGAGDGDGKGKPEAPQPSAASPGGAVGGERSRTAAPLTLQDYMPPPKFEGKPASPGGAGNPEDYGKVGNSASLLNEWAIEAMAEEGEATSNTSGRTNAMNGDADSRLAASPGGAVGDLSRPRTGDAVPMPREEEDGNPLRTQVKEAIRGVVKLVEEVTTSIMDRGDAFAKLLVDEPGVLKNYAMTCEKKILLKDPGWKDVRRPTSRTSSTASSRKRKNEGQEAGKNKMAIDDVSPPIEVNTCSSTEFVDFSAMQRPRRASPSVEYIGGTFVGSLTPTEPFPPPTPSPLVVQSSPPGQPSYVPSSSPLTPTSPATPLTTASPGGAVVTNGATDGDGDVSMPDPRSDEIIQELKSKLALSEQQLLFLDEHLTLYDRAYDEVDEKRQTLEGQVNWYHNMAEKQRSDFEAMIAAAQGQHKATVDQLNASQQTMQGQIALLQEKVAQLQKEKGSLKMVLDLRSVELKEYTEATKKEMEVKEAHMTEEIKKVKFSLALKNKAMEDATKEATNLKAQLDAEKHARSSKETEMMLQNGKILELEKKVSELGTASAQTSALQNRITILENEKEQALILLGQQANSGETASTLAKLQSDIQKEKEGFKKFHGKAMGLCKGMEERIKALEDKNKELTESLQDKEYKLNVQSSELEAAREQISRLEGDELVHEYEGTDWTLGSSPNRERETEADAHEPGTVTAALNDLDQFASSGGERLGGDGAPQHACDNTANLPSIPTSGAAFLGGAVPPSAGPPVSGAASPGGAAPIGGGTPAQSGAQGHIGSHTVPPPPPGFRQMSAAEMAALPPWCYPASMMLPPHMFPFIQAGAPAAQAAGAGRQTEMAESASESESGEEDGDQGGEDNEGAGGEVDPPPPPAERQAPKTDEDEEIVTSYSIKRREADKVTVPALPGVNQLIYWRASVARNLQAASGRTDDSPTEWLLEAEKKGVTFDDMAKCKEEFMTLDNKLCAALSNCIKNGKALMLEQEFLTKEAEMLQKQKTIRGRQVYWLIIQFRKTSESLGGIYNLQDLISVKWMGDQNMFTFYNKWKARADAVIQDGGTNKKGLRDLLYEQMSKSRALQADLAHYHRQDEDSEDKTVDFLYKIMGRHIERERLEQARHEQLHGAGRGTPSIAAPAEGGKSKEKGKGKDGKKKNKAKAKAEPKKPPKKKEDQVPIEQCCWFFNNAPEGCTRGESCKFVHKLIKKEQRSKIPKPMSLRQREASRTSQSPGKNQGDGKKKEKEKRYCVNFLKGKCNKGDLCLFPHMSQKDVDEIVRADKARAKAKGKAKPKAKAKAQP